MEKNIIPKTASELERSTVLTELVPKVLLFLRSSWFTDGRTRNVILNLIIRRFNVRAPNAQHAPKNNNGGEEGGNKKL